MATLRHTRNSSRVSLRTSPGPAPHWLSLHLDKARLTWTLSWVPWLSFLECPVAATPPWHQPWALVFPLAHASTWHMVTRPAPFIHVPPQDLQQLQPAPWYGGPLHSVSWWPLPWAPPSRLWLTEFLSLQTGSLGPEHPSETLSLAPWPVWLLHQ